MMHTYLKSTRLTAPYATDRLPEQSTSVAKEVPPFLKWAGGKRWLTHALTRAISVPYCTYVEPFLGSGAAFFSLRPESAVLSDTNADLINAFHSIREHAQLLFEKLKKHSQDHSPRYYYEVRGSVPQDPIERAARFIYLNRTCWNGLYRVNRDGIFNVPIGSKSSALLESDDFCAVADALESAELLISDFEKVIDQCGSGFLIFADPPYTVKHNNNGFVKYNNKIFSWADQVRLKNSLVRAKSRGAEILMTNANHESVRELYSGFFLTTLRRNSAISGKPSFRCATEELLVSSFPADFLSCTASEKT